MASGGAALQEYLISLGVKADWSNVNKVMSFLNSGTLKTAAFGTALVAAGKAMYNFIKTNVQAEQSFASLARTQNKSLETVRAEQNALKAMGKTMSEVSKDPALKTIYNDIVKVNKSLALPDMKGAMAMISQLQGAFYELKSVISYATQWINYHILANLQEPIQRITDYLKKISDFIRKDINGFSSKIASYMTAFSKGLLGIVELGVKIVEWIEKLPSGIKAAGTAIVGVFALLKSGPLGQLLAVITAVGGLIDDYENFQWNKTAPEGEKVDVAFGGIWEILDADDKTLGEKLGAIGEKIGTKLSESFENVKLDLTKWVTDHQEDITNAATEAAKFITNALQAGVEFVGMLTNWLKEAQNNPDFMSAVDSMIQAIKDAFVALGEFVATVFETVWASMYEDMDPDLKKVLASMGYTEDKFYRSQTSGVDENGSVVTYKEMKEKGYTNKQIIEARERGKTNPSRMIYDNLMQNGSGAGITLDENGRMSWAQGKYWGTSDIETMTNLFGNFGKYLYSDPGAAALYAQEILKFGNNNDATGGNRRALEISEKLAGTATESPVSKAQTAGLDIGDLIYTRNQNFSSADFQQSVEDALSGTSELTWETGEPTVPSDAGTTVIKEVQKQVDSSGKKVEVSVGSKHGGSVGATFGNAWGGRYNHPITTEVAEDGGTEYIIPLNKPARAMSLIKQMFSEMGGVATNQLMKDLGLGVEGTVGSSAASISAMAGGSNISNSYNISAPVTIQVTASGSDAKAIGTAAYSAAERQLIRSLKGVLA